VSVASKPKKNARYDLKAADRKRNLFVQIGLTSIVVLFAAALILYILMSADEKPTAGETKSVRVASNSVITKEGTDEPKAVISLYEDALCPACAAFEQQFGPTLTNITDSGAAAIDYHMVGILNRPQNDNYSSRAGGAAYCVADQSVDAFKRFHAALYAQQPSETGTSYPDNAQLIELARQAGASENVPECISKGTYVDMVAGMAGAADIRATPTIRINGEDYQYSTPEALIAKIEEIVGDVPGLEAGPPAQLPTPAS